MALLLNTLIIVIFGAFWVWMLVDCALNEAESGNTKLVWVVIIIFTSIVGATIYLFIRRPQRKVELGR